MKTKNQILGEIIDRETSVEAENWKTGTREYFQETARPMILQTWRRSGLEAIVNEAINSFPIHLPYNLEGDAPYRGRSRYRNHADFDDVAIPTFRFCGWLKAASKFRILVNLIDRNTSQNGMGSPYTIINPWEMSKKHPSPGKLARFLRAVKKRGNEILDPFGLQVSWYSLGKLINEGTTWRIGKAAVMVAGETVREFLSRGQNENYLGGELSGRPRDVLVKARGLKELMKTQREIASWAIDRTEDGEFSCFREALSSSNRLVENTSDGVKLMLDPVTTRTLHGVKAVIGWWDGRYYDRKQWLLDGGGRFYHIDASLNLRVAIKKAFRAWDCQKGLERENQELLRKLNPANMSILVYLEDSYQAGNCKAGTEAFLKANGLGEKKLVPVKTLLPHLSNSAVYRVLNSVASQL